MKKIIIGILTIYILFLVWSQYRYFIVVENTTFTIWKKNGGYCYITPYKYYSFRAPKKDYIRVSNIGSLIIVVENDSSFIIFNNRYIDNDSVNVNFTNYKYKYFSPNPPTLEKIEEWESKVKNSLENYSYLDIDIRWMLTYIDNKE